jgi:hypothetical protein
LATIRVKYPRQPRRPTGLLAGPREKVVEALLVRDWSKRRRRLFLGDAVELARGDETFRRDLLDKLKTLGAGKRGRLNPVAPEIGRKYLKGIFETARTLLTNAGHRASNGAAAQYIVDVMGLELDTDPETLRKRYEREMKKR